MLNSSCWPFVSLVKLNSDDTKQWLICLTVLTDSLHVYPSDVMSSVLRVPTCYHPPYWSPTSFWRTLEFLFYPSSPRPWRLCSRPSRLVCQKDYAISAKQISTKLGGRMGHRPREKPLHFSLDWDKGTYLIGFTLGHRGPGKCGCELSAISLCYTFKINKIWINWDQCSVALEDGVDCSE